MLQSGRCRRYSIRVTDAQRLATGRATALRRGNRVLRLLKRARPDPHALSWCLYVLLWCLALLRLLDDTSGIGKVFGRDASACPGVGATLVSRVDGIVG